ncbi:MAG: radical SAM family heme chaperone HemW [Boseongicola sp.]|nr:radical SAM family heme chaperone HemW [Boseongicola sp.]MDD9979399.1 radical SAM family heme chaperone HemW [Boseongicola sp.]
MAELPGFGLYVHWPFCQAKCPYCDFNSHVSTQIDHAEWARAYEMEIERLGEETGERRLNSVFFGGGTPSLMDPQTVERVLSSARRVWSFANDIEITLEANPTSVEADRFKSFFAAGVNRVSVGLQALNDADLKQLGRLHTADEGRRAFDIARAVFPRSSFDLIYARQDQSLSDWEAELAEAIAFASAHLSLYQLTIEPGTAFGDRQKRGLLRGLPPDDLAADMYEMTQQMTLDAGLPAYETSNHAQAGDESKHNLIYWRGGDWAAIGPGGHGRLTLDGSRYATETPRSPKEWLGAALNGENPENRTVLSQEEINEEAVMMGLRLAEGVEAALIPQFEEKINNINGLAESNLIELHDGRIMLTAAGRPLLNAVLRELLV